MYITHAFSFYNSIPRTFNDLNDKLINYKDFIIRYIKIFLFKLIPYQKYVVYKFTLKMKKCLYKSHVSLNLLICNQNTIREKNESF